MVASFSTKQYNHTTAKFLGQTVDLTALKAMLLDNNATFVATHTALASVSNSNAYEVSGNGWTAGGEPFTGATVSVTTTDDAKLQGADIRVRATGGIIGPVSAIVIFDNTDVNKAPLFYIECSEPIYSGEGVDFLIPGLILTLTYTAP